MEKNVFIQTWGCQMNVADSERMQALLSRDNYQPATDAESADIIILNTCHIRDHARHKVVSRLGELRRLKERKPDLVLAVAGCVAQAEAKQLRKQVPFVDLIFGPDQIEKVPELVQQTLERRFGDEGQAHDTYGKHLDPLIHTRFTDDEYSIPLDRASPLAAAPGQSVSRFVNIIKGCNNYCTFCVVPYTRGREKSRPEREILDEVSFYRDSGTREVVLLGQNVNSYGLDRPDAKGLPFADLLYQVAAVEGIERIRFMTSNPHDFTPALAQAFADLPKLASAFHLPVQSGSDRVLKRMNRQYTRAQYLDRVQMIRQARPDVAFSSDMIVGFPGETDEDFEDTLSLVREMRYAFVYAYKYSKRAGTPAARFKEMLPEEVLDERLQRLLALQDQITTDQNRNEIGRQREVLVLYKDSKKEDSWYGRTFEGRLVRVHSDRGLVGQIVPVEIFDANKTACLAKPVF
jgi:tRNA-2-methylthio-N6-dimethylallyladenosine synthase